MRLKDPKSGRKIKNSPKLQKKCKKSLANSKLSFSFAFANLKLLFLTHYITTQHFFLKAMKEAYAGTLESGDIMIQIEPAETQGLTIELNSTVMYQFGEQIRNVITETLTGLGVTDALVKATDKGALDCTIRARVTAAAVRATGKDVWAD